MAGILNNLNIETVVTDEEAADGLEAALGMEVEDYRDSEGEEGGEGTLRALGAHEFLAQDANLSETTLVDARNGFNKLSRLAMLWTLQHRWPAGRGSRSIAISIGHNFYSASRGSLQLQF